MLYSVRVAYKRKVFSDDYKNKLPWFAQSTPIGHKRNKPQKASIQLLVFLSMLERLQLLI
jgi:hypothetical protein